MSGERRIQGGNTGYYMVRNQHEVSSIGQSAMQKHTPNWTIRRASGGSFGRTRRTSFLVLCL